MSHKADAAVLRKAAKYIKKYGLSKGEQSEKQRAPACMMNAIFRVLGGMKDYVHYAHVIDVDLPRFSRMLGFKHEESSWKWNDMKRRTAEDVIDRLNSAAEKLDAS